MAEENRQVSSRYDLDAKWDACLDLSLRRFVYSSLAGAVSGLLLFRTPVTRWASVAFGAGVGIGSAYTECSYIFEGSSPKQCPPKISVESAPPSQVIFLRQNDDLNWSTEFLQPFICTGSSFGIFMKHSILGDNKGYWKGNCYFSAEKLSIDACELLKKCIAN